VSILKPLCGAFDGLAENLESFVRLNYPQFEILLGVKSSHDSALPVAREFQKRHPHLPINIVVNDQQFGWNPKMNNLVPMMRRAAHDLVLISDDNVRVEPNYLRDTAAEMTGHTGLVYNLILGAQAVSLGAILENLHLNSFIMGSMCFLQNALRHPCVIGKSMLFRRSTIQRIGGVEAVKNALAEDYLLGRYFQRHGYRVALSSHPINNINSDWPLRRFVNRHARWAKMRFWIGTYRYAAEWLGNPIAVSLIVFMLQPGWSTFGLSILISAAKAFLDWMASRKLAAEAPMWHYLLTPLKDILIGLIWFAPFLNRTIVWREKKFKLNYGSKLQPYEENQVREEIELDPLPALC
jgi:ceramide glucosyltransferase